MSRNCITSGILATLWCLEDARYARSPSYSNSFVMGEIHIFFPVEIRTFEKGSRWCYHKVGANKWYKFLMQFNIYSCCVKSRKTAEEGLQRT